MANVVGEPSSSFSNSSNQKSSSSKWNTQRSLIPIVLGFCCLLVSGVNLWQAQQTLDAVVPHRGRPGRVDLSSVHKAVRQFAIRKSETKNNKEQNTAAASSTGGLKDERPPGRGAEVDGAGSTTTDRDEPKYPLLECAAYGGPNVDASQEMVYWQDIPSDTRYVSPFKGSNDDGSPKYMTFEPDGGGTCGSC
jgi:hypothetical protein